MTIVSSLFGASKPVAEESTPTGEVPAPASTPIAQSGSTGSRRVYKGTIFFRSSPRRRRHRLTATATARYAFIMIVSISILVDLYALLTTDPDNPGPLVELTGIQPNVNIYILLMLHMLTLYGGLSKTVFGVRVATAIVWMFMMASMFALIVVPSFIGSYVGSGLAPVMQNGTLVSQCDPQQRFQTGFYMAVGGQLFVFVLFMTTLFQLTICAQLLVEAHIIQATAEIAKIQANDALLHTP